MRTFSLHRLITLHSINSKKNNFMGWRKLNGERLPEDIVATVEQTIKQEAALGHRLKVCIGTDSQVKGQVIEFATVIVFVREKRGGFMFIHHEKIKAAMGIKERMISEVAKSIDIAYQLCNLLDQYKIELEVHADINTSPQFKSNSALSEAMGYILSMGFVFKAKPDAFASSYCANKIVH
jgi:predicted RNase H-related nuclease YkuK (DUF458 family)